MKIYLISDNMDTLVGMRLCGIKGTIVKDKSELEGLLEELVKDKDMGIILITEGLAKIAENQIAFIKEKMAFPLIAEIPDSHGSIKGPDYITNYVRDSIGIKV